MSYKAAAISLTYKFPASWHPGRQWLHQPIHSLHQPIRVPPPARVLHQPPMPELLPEVPEDFTREVRRRLHTIDPPADPEPQPELSPTPRDGVREESISEVRRLLDRVDHVLLHVHQRLDNMEQRRVIDERFVDEMVEAQLNYIRITQNICRLLPERQVDLAEDSDGLA